MKSVQVNKDTKRTSSDVVLMPLLSNFVSFSHVGLVLLLLTSTSHRKQATSFPAGTQRLHNVSFKAYLCYVMYERLHNVGTTFVNERCFTYV